MVTRWGLTEALGPLTYSEDEGEVFLGRSVTQHKNISDETAKVIDEEVRILIDTNYQRAETLLKKNEDILHSMAKALMKYETLDSDQIGDLMQRIDVRKPDGWDDSGNSGGNTAGHQNDGKDDTQSSSDKPEIGGPAEEL